MRDIVFNLQRILFQPLIIGYRNGTYYVIDGRHRREAAIQLGFDRVPCMVYDTKSAAQEAEAFLWLQEKRREITAPQKLVTRIAFGDAKSIAISTLMAKYGFEINKYEGFGLGARQNNVIVSIFQS